MDGLQPSALKVASYSGSRSNVAMPNQPAPSWKGLHSKIEPNHINDLLYANVGVPDGFGV